MNDADAKPLGQIDVRFVVPFHKAPDVQPLLINLPPRDRSALVLTALREFIVHQNHPAGQINTQLKSLEA